MTAELTERLFVAQSHDFACKERSFDSSLNIQSERNSLESIVSHSIDAYFVVRSFACKVSNLIHFAAKQRASKSATTRNEIST